MVRDNKLDDEDNVEYKAPQDVLTFIDQAPGMLINSKDVQEVRADEFEKLQKQHEEMLDRLENDKAALKREMESQREEMQEAVRKAQMAAQQAIEEASRRAEEFERKQEIMEEQ